MIARKGAKFAKKYYSDKPFTTLVIPFMISKDPKFINKPNRISDTRK